MGRFAWERWAAILFCLLAGGGILILTRQYVLPILLPFLAAWLISLIVRPAAERVAGHLHLPPKLCAALVLTLLLATLMLLLGLAARRLMLEMSRLLELIIENDGRLPGVVDESFDLFAFLMERLGIDPGADSGYELFRERFYEMLTDMTGHMTERLSAEIPTFAARVFVALPSILLFLVITVIAAFYFCMDDRAIEQRLFGLLPRQVREKLPLLRGRARQISWRYLKVYLLLLLLTFGELLVGFLILGVEYAFLLALIIAVLDMLPIIGVGTVLIPWSLVAFFQKDFYLGFGLAILYLILTVLRQIVEPKLLGKSLGLHPLLTLFAGYTGWRLLGFLGMLLGPVAAVLIKSAVSPIVSLFRQNATP